MVDFCNAQAHIENELLCHRIAGMDDYCDLLKQPLVLRQSGCRLIFAYPYATDSAGQKPFKGNIQDRAELDQEVQTQRPSGAFQIAIMRFGNAQFLSHFVLCETRPLARIPHILSDADH